jgi:type II restriction enzyme
MRISLGEEVMNPVNSYKSHLSGPGDLVTTHEEYRAGFIALALEKNTRASPFIIQAKSLRQAASAAKSPRGLLEMPFIEYALLKAAGVSDKAESYLTEEDKENAKINLIEKFLEPAGPSFVDELVYRFLLTQGDALGGIMRNIGGKWGKIKFLDMMMPTCAKEKFRPRSDYRL